MGDQYQYHDQHDYNNQSWADEARQQPNVSQNHTMDNVGSSVTQTPSLNSNVGTIKYANKEQTVISNEESTGCKETEINDSALNAINDDFWDMRISVHADDALS